MLRLKYSQNATSELKNTIKVSNNTVTSNKKPFNAHIQFIYSYILKTWD